MRLQELLIDDDDITGFYQADEEFHHLLMEFTGFQRLPDVAQTVSLQVTRARILLLPTPGRTAETLEEHRAVFDAIATETNRQHSDAMQCAHRAVDAAHRRPFKLTNVRICSISIRPAET